jgi:hypothetical protein
MYSLVSFGIGCICALLTLRLFDDIGLGVGWL